MRTTESRFQKVRRCELTVKALAKNDLVLDLESVTVGGQRYAVTADDAAMGNEQKDGIGKNKRTAEYVGGGAVLGTIIGAIAGGKKAPPSAPRQERGPAPARRS